VRLVSLEKHVDKPHDASPGSRPDRPLAHYSPQLAHARHLAPL